jgi:hypothetical protein
MTRLTNATRFAWPSSRSLGYHDPAGGPDRHGCLQRGRSQACPTARVFMQATLFSKSCVETASGVCPIPARCTMRDKGAPIHWMCALVRWAALPNEVQMFGVAGPRLAAA